jgi:acetyl esterase/lipase
MITATIRLKEVFKGLTDSSFDPILSAYVVEGSEQIHPNYKRPSVLICPGGAYELTSDREAEPVALRFAAAGYNAFVLRYSVKVEKYPTQLLEVSAATAYIRRMAEEWGIDKDKIIVCGFSAGGHLAGSLGVFWNQTFIQEKLGIAYAENKPNAMILCYPVITGGIFAHRGSFNNLLGEGASKEELDKLSLEQHVTKNVPPTFIWHTLDDQAVPVENALFFAKALREKDVVFEMHIYNRGVHGLSLCDETTSHIERPDQMNPHARTWFNLVLEWLKDIL